MVMFERSFWCPFVWPWDEAGMASGESRARLRTGTGDRGPGALKLQTLGAPRKAVDAVTLSGEKGTVTCLSLFIYIIHLKNFIKEHFKHTHK